MWFYCFLISWSPPGNNVPLPGLTAHIIIIIIIIMIYCPKWKIWNWENLFWKFFLPNLSWARQPLSSARSTLLYPFQMLSAKQGSSNSHLLTSFGMTRPGIETHDLPIMRRTLYWLSQHISLNTLCTQTFFLSLYFEETIITLHTGFNCITGFWPVVKPVS